MLHPPLILSASGKKKDPLMLLARGDFFAIFRANFPCRCYVSATRLIYYENLYEKSVTYGFVVPIQHRRNAHAWIRLNFLICIGFFGIHWHFWRSVAPCKRQIPRLFGVQNGATAYTAQVCGTGSPSRAGRYCAQTDNGFQKQGFV